MFILVYNNTIDKEKFYADNEKYLEMVREEDYTFLCYAKYGEDASMHELALKVRRREASAEEIQKLIDYAISGGGLEYAQWHMKDMQGMADGLIDDTRDAAVTEALHLLASFVAERVF